MFGRSKDESPWKGYSAYLVGLLALVAGGTLWWSQQPNFHVVIPDQVYRSAQPSEEDLRLYHEQYGIKTVINLRGTWEGKSWYDAEHRLGDEMGVEVVDINLVNHQLPPLEELRKLVRTLDEAPRPILIHCRGGADRTALASAVARVLAGESIRHAQDEYSLWCGHTGLAHGSHLPNTFDLYESWLKEEKKTHSPEVFRSWVNDVESLHYFAAEIEPTVSVASIHEGELWELGLRITNTSKVAWPADTLDMHVNVWMRPQGVREGIKERVELPSRSIAPGESIRVTVPMPAIASSGIYHLEADVCDGKDIKFRVMGPFAWKTNVEVLPRAASHAKSD